MSDTPRVTNSPDRRPDGSVRPLKLAAEDEAGPHSEEARKKARKDFEDWLDKKATGGTGDLGQGEDIKARRKDDQTFNEYRRSVKMAEEEPKGEDKHPGYGPDEFEVRRKRQDARDFFPRGKATALDEKISAKGRMEEKRAKMAKGERKGDEVVPEDDARGESYVKPHRDNPRGNHPEKGKGSTIPGDTEAGSDESRKRVGKHAVGKRIGTRPEKMAAEQRRPDGSLKPMSEWDQALQKVHELFTEQGKNAGKKVEAKKRKEKVTQPELFHKEGGEKP